MRTAVTEPAAAATGHAATAPVTGTAHSMPATGITDHVTATGRIDIALLAEHEWRAREAQHQARADAFSRGWRERQGTGVKHPVDDFLFTYYPIRPSILRRWHPGAGVQLAGAAGDERAAWKWYERDNNALRVDAAGFAAAHAGSIRFIVSLLSATAARPAQLSCFGLHEWAMVYRAGAAEVSPHRHDVPLRLGQQGTDAVVEANRITCTHFDAFRFFTPEAVPLNRLEQPTRANQPATEQPGCLHAGMDVYKWATKLGPLIPGDLLLDCFELARDIRELDMRAAPYDLADWGYEPVRIEQPEGRAEYARQQRGFAERSNALRRRVIAAVEVATAGPHDSASGTDTSGAVASGTETSGAVASGTETSGAVASGTETSGADASGAEARPAN